MDKSLKLIIEALLFAAEGPLSERDLHVWLHDAAPARIQEALNELQQEYETLGRSFSLKQVAGAYQFRTRPEYADYVLLMLKAAPGRLSRAAMETLAIVAYKQPILRVEIERLRGVDVGGILKTLMEKDLVRIMGRKNLPGRPLIYGTTRKFLEVFDLKDLDSLPKLKEIKDLGADEGQAAPPAEDETEDAPNPPDEASGREEAGPPQAFEEAPEREALSSGQDDEAPDPDPQPLAPAEKDERINRILSLAGLTSRRKADEWIGAGRVRINGKKVTEPGTKAIWGEDRIQVDGRDIPGPSTRLYLMLNKPFGYICSMSDPEGRPLVTDLLKDIPQRLYSVGRLDFDSMGLLLLTNDGEWANRLTHPRYRIPRTYKATVEGAFGEDELDRLRRGVMLSDGPTLPARVAVIRRGEGRSQLRITIRQGRSRQVRRMLEAVGHPVSHLIRIGFGTLALGDLKVGEYRVLEAEELEDLNRSISDRRIPKPKIANPEVSDRPRPSSNRKSKIENRK